LEEVMDIVRQDETLDDLQIKDIKILQKKSGFRFGVDAVLLANFAKAKENHKVIDLCTGTGIIAFIMAGKTPAQSIKGIDIQKEMIDMAKRSVDINGLQNRMEFINEDLKNLKELKKIEKAPTMVLIEGQRDGGAFLRWDNPLYVYDEHGDYSKEINEIYGR